ncbi:YgiQ family radical SAM protein [Bacteriovoracaceae bacterium]|nr:YgiQ family radical SAM protein [Bacteriovoracaceae bacterium]
MNQKSHSLNIPITNWLPVSRKEVLKRGWDELDVIIISGDAYVDHPAFGNAVIGRIIESYGFKVAIIPQPNWQDDLRDFKKLGKPKYFFGVTAGNMDSMVNKYTAGKRKREKDAYSPNGLNNLRPDYATTTYTKILKELYPDTPVVIGGIEASLRRVTHFDFWEDKLLPNILTESGADLLIYGMGEQPLRELLHLLQKGVPFSSLRTIPQTAVLVNQYENLPKNKNWEDIELNSHEVCLKDKKKYAANFKIVEIESNKVKADRILQSIGTDTLVINPPYPVMTEKEMDYSFSLPFTRYPHPKYRGKTISAYEMIKFSVNMHRGCFGGCSFCTISAHQGKFIASRSEDSIMKEVDEISKMDDFKGYLSDLGGPSANMYQMKGIDQEICDRCTSSSCIFPTVCRNLDTSPKAMRDIYEKVRKHPEVKKAFVSSGLRYDLMFNPHSLNKKEDEKYCEDLVTHHVSGRLKVAPEHTQDSVLKLMRKPSFRYFKIFKTKFEEICRNKGLRQEIIPYFISSHPGADEIDMANLAIKTKEHGYKLEQVQDFTPTPMTLATEIYYSGYHPYTLKKVYTATKMDAKNHQRNFFFWYKKGMKERLLERLKKFNRLDLYKRIYQS